jgi:hypothetical protein
MQNKKATEDMIFSRFCDNCGFDYLVFVNEISALGLRHAL